MNNLKEYRKRKGLTQTQLSARTGVIQTTISKLENGVFPMSLHAASIFARVLDCKPEDLIGEDNVRIKVDVVKEGYVPSCREVAGAFVRMLWERIVDETVEHTYDDELVYMMLSLVLAIPDERMEKEWHDLSRKIDRENHEEKVKEESKDGLFSSSAINERKL